MSTATNQITEDSNDTQSPDTSSSHRKISVLLIIGILVCPAIFAWFTLRKGYSQRARTISFVYMVMYVIGNSSHSAKPPRAAPHAYAEVQASAAPMLTPQQANLQLIEEIDAKGGRCSAMATTLRHWQRYSEQSGNDAPFMRALGEATDMGC
jgi:hypothetical protein